jgi:hypothetical protein
VSANGAPKQRDSLSLTTLFIAAIASGAAAIVTSHFWKGGTIMTAALTPVIVALVKEGLQRPIQSDLVRRPVQRLAESRTVRQAPEYARAGGRSRFDEPERDAAPAPPFAETQAHGPGNGNGDGNGSMSPVRTYGGRPARRWHLRAAIVTGVIAFAIAAIVLTVPELVFGGSVAGKGRTTFFSTHRSARSSSPKSDQQKTSPESTKTDTNQQQTTPPSQQPTDTQTTTQPQQATPPSQSSPGGSAAPQQSPAPVAPPASPSP